MKPAASAAICVVCLLVVACHPQGVYYTVTKEDPLTVVTIHNTDEGDVPNPDR